MFGIPPLYRTLLLFLFRIKHPVPAIHTAVWAGVMCPARLAAVWACHQLGQGQMMVRAPLALPSV
jgi:hypothetical protein